MEQKQIDLYEFLVESELQHYYNAFKNELKITNASQFKYATDEDLKQIGLSRPEIRRLRKFHEKYFPHGYISKLKRFLQAPTVKKDELPTVANALTSAEPNKTYSPKQVPNNKHIIPADAICVNKQLGTGEFGIVQQGVWTNGNDRIQVAIKCLCRERMQSNPMEFLKEASIMHSIEHENIVRLYGVVLATDTLMLVTELAHLRSLLECLKDSGLRVSFLTVPTLCEFAMQICNGMMYLENKRLIHRDLAARNILVFSKNKVKISDFGLSRALGVGKDYYKTNFNVNLKLPIAWCAPECINYLRFTNSSDVWAFGVSLWEMFSYGFQPWAALTGLQILEAIDEPNYQRLEQPECCPKEYYNLMLKCWQHDPVKRPKFSEIYQMLPDIKPEQLKTVVNHCEPKKDHLMYRQGEIITVLDRNTNSLFWKGVLNSGKTGYFNPTNTVAHLEGLPSASRFPSDTDTLCRSGSERCSKRKLRTEMISKPQDDFKHTGHVGIDGASFGDIAFLANPQNYNHLPRQVVTPYKPSEDIEQTPLLLPPTPTSPDSLQTASGYFSEENPISTTNPTFRNSIEESNTRKPHHSAFGSFDFSSKKSMLNSLNPFASENVSSRNSSSSFAMQNNNYGLEASAFTNANLEDDSFNEPQHNLHHNAQDQKYGLNNWTGNKLNSISDQETQHEYHEISDDEITTENVFDLGPSLLDEINSMFGSINGAAEDNASNFFEFDHTNKKNEMTELNSKHNRKNSTNDTNGNKSKKKNSSGIVKQISVKDEKILNHAIEIANEISARSMTDLVSENTCVAHSPKRKFSFRFPNLSHHTNDKDISIANGSTSGTLSYTKEKKNFTEELKSIPDLQNSITEEGKIAYNSLIERKGGTLGSEHFDSNEFNMTTAKTLPRRSVDFKTTAIPQLANDFENGKFSNALHPNRPMTLPNRGLNKLKNSDLTVDCNKKFGFLRSSSKLQTIENDENVNFDKGNSGSESASPSYLLNTPYTFPERQQNNLIHDNGYENSNPIPLPPRDRNKIIKANPKRHVRKHPLIIPAQGLLRTHNLIPNINGSMAANDQENHNHNRSMQSTKLDKNRLSYSIKSNLNDENNCKKTNNEMIKQTISHNNNNHRTSLNCENLRDSRIYANVSNNIQSNINDSNTDSASLHFESVLEGDCNKTDILSSPDVIDGFCPFAIQKEIYNKETFDNLKLHDRHANNEDELRNLDIEREKEAFLPKTDKLNTTNNTNLPTACGGGGSGGASRVDNSIICNPLKLNKSKGKDNELAGHALFNKVRENVDSAMEKLQNDKRITSSIVSNGNSSNNKNVSGINSGSKMTNDEDQKQQKLTETALANSNSVSCEDLLEFSDKKPKGCERGVDSDEVRIMIKVLGKASTPQRCLSALEFIDWDVHRAIKLIKLQNILNTFNLSLSDCVDALQKYDWDLQVTALKMHALKS